jgi:hypothetical protein
MPEPSRLLEVSHAGVIPGSEISFGGSSSLPEGTVLESQLYDAEGAVDWWPDDARAEVWGPRGSWDITVSLGGLSDEATGLYIGSPVGFRLDVWVRDDPAIRAGYSLDLMGPPAR